ncbi:MAG: serine/threonine protein kinase [Myxococcales bacterium]|nr:serine/threonine protein kinase [Myxococcales bacterium]
MSERRDDDAGHADTVASGGDAPATPADGGPAIAPAAAAVGPGSQLGRYQLIDELGSGGMATVYRARDRELRREVAVKVLFPHLAKKAELTRRFQREARAAAGLEHPNILRVYDVGADGAPHIVMELVRGQSLRERAEAEGALLAELVAAIGACLCGALAVAHAAGVVHRDVKPANVMIADDGRLLLADFGVARIDDDDSLHTRTGALLGTPSFMAPEQAHGDALDGRADLYAVGVTLYQLATGGLPFAGPTAKIVAEAQRGATPALRRQPAVGAPLSRLIARLMDPDPGKRPADAATAAAELTALVTAGGLGAPADEVRAWALDPAAYRAARTPTVIAALMAEATAAVAQGATARALATCDRVLALAPAHAGAAALVARVTRQGQTRRWLLGGAAALALGGGAVGAWRVLGGAAAPGAPDAAAVVDGGALIDGMTDGALADAATPDAAGDAGPGPDAAAPRDAGDRATARRDAGAIEVAAIVDAAVSAPVDAAPVATIDAPPAPGAVVLRVDAWCDLAIDGQARGRASAAPIELPPGRHTLVCKQGLGQGAWRQEVVVTSGVTQTLDVTLLASVVVVNGLADTIRLRDRALAPGAEAALRPGRVQVERLRGDDASALGWITVPAVGRCTVRSAPELACYP